MSFTPNSLSKEKLKSELIARNIPLPPSAAKKDVYVQLYAKHIMTLPKTQKISKEILSEFSSDEDDSSKTTKTQMRQRTIFTSSGDIDRNESIHSVIVDGLNVSQLSDDELRQRLLDFNQTVGPIVETTRSVYERQLARLLRGDMEGEVPNGKFRPDEYSDSEGETEAVNSPPPLLSSQHSSVQISKKTVKEQETPQIVLEDSDNLLIHRTFSRETPTPRRSLRADIKYTPTDRKLYSEFIRRDNEAVSKLASTVVENAPEPTKKTSKAKGMSWVFKLVSFLIGLGILFVLIYYNMEMNDTQEINHLPGNNVK